ncbi:u2 small nuclear ribonucleo protein B''-like protein [Piromyces finnis]|uniref:U2 small nuclear ribonucleo protein B''-like protein n=1 Tax=Piromyces finnis TaxID=1754191 RepID=A0A1Y1UZZ3_9FUNG|nr:u2 small nuclear ribonucleo protein B''-like protein [Piromyces finnis]|eukprot:ORX44211.1 u2 small nuclear ribonucleo protein B''-like protein [Piromyces finnis]
MSSIPPNKTLYVNNLNEKIQKEELRKALYYLFSQYGRVVDVVALKTIKMRGQAFIVYREITEATKAMRSLQGFPLFDKPIKIDYAKTRSNKLNVLDGEYKLDESNTQSIYSQMFSESKFSQGVTTISKKREHEEDDQSNKKMALDKTDEEEENVIPNRILFLQNLPMDITEKMLSYLFVQYPGFKEIRLVPGKPDIAFAEYENELQAQTALKVLDGFNITPTNAMKVEFAKI